MSSRPRRLAPLPPCERPVPYDVDNTVWKMAPKLTPNDVTGSGRVRRRPHTAASHCRTKDVARMNPRMEQQLEPLPGGGTESYTTELMAQNDALHKQVSLLEKKLNEDNHRSAMYQRRLEMIIQQMAVALKEQSKPHA